MSILAFLAPMPAKVTKTETSALPEFKPRWWYKADRLDARPVIWSLDNHPEEWRVTHEGNYNLTITHIPSNHQFWSCLAMGYRLYRADCSCSSSSSRKWQRFQFWTVGRAIRQWVRNERAKENIAENFHSHFVH